MDIIENAKRHYQDKIGPELCSIDVPEWGDGEGKPAVIYFRPSMTMNQQAAITGHSNAADRVVETLMQRALRADGSRLFKPANRVEVMRCFDSDVINQVVIRLSTYDPEPDDAGKL